MELVIFTSSDASRAAMAAAFLNALVHPALACAIAAIPDPSVAIDAGVEASFNDLGLDRQLIRPARFTTQLGERAAEVIHVGKSVRPPWLDGIEALEWDVPDPRKFGPDEIAAIRDALRRRIEEHLHEKHWMREPPQAQAR